MIMRPLDALYSLVSKYCISSSPCTYVQIGNTNNTAGRECIQKKTKWSFDHYIVELSVLHLSCPEFWLSSLSFDYYHRWSFAVLLHLIRFLLLQRELSYDDSFTSNHILCNCAKNPKPSGYRHHCRYRTFDLVCTTMQSNPLHQWRCTALRVVKCTIQFLYTILLSTEVYWYECSPRKSYRYRWSENWFSVYKTEQLFLSQSHSIFTLIVLIVVAWKIYVCVKILANNIDRKLNGKTLNQSTPTTTRIINTAH